MTLIVILPAGPGGVAPDDLARHKLYVSAPALWPRWPVLPVIRRRPGGADEAGLLFDARGVCDRTGYSATVFRTNVLALPPTVDELLALPREVYDSADEVVAAGWRVDVRAVG